MKEGMVEITSPFPLYALMKMILRKDARIS